MKDINSDVHGGETMKRNVFALILTVLFATAAQAERAIVIMKDAKSFKAVNLSSKLGTWSGMGSVKVEDSLHNLNTIIVDVKDEASFNQLKSNPMVAYVEKEIFHEAPRPVRGFLAAPAAKIATISQKQPWGIAAVKAPQAWPASNEGEGARVLVLDTGIDHAHVGLAANFEQGRDFTNLSNGSDFSDPVGHGTHVAGTIAGIKADSGFTGVAPKAKVLMGRVCSTNGCSNVAIAQGINWGITQKVDVISMSLGGMWSTPAERDAVTKADQAGITVVAASGNSGTPRVSYPAALPTVIAVGAIAEDLKKADFSQWGPELAVVAPGVAVVSSVPTGTGREASVEIAMAPSKSGKVNASTFQGAKEILTPETNELVAAGLGKPEDFSKVNVSGKYALVSRGEIAFADKVKNAMAAGATGVVVYNNAPGLIQGSLTNDGSVLPVAVFMIEQEVGNKIVANLGAGQVVKATLQTLATDFSAFDGTSMATPHVAGVVALMKAANKSLTGAQVKQILQQTALPLGPNTANEYGAGLVNAEAAVNAALAQ